MTTLLFFIIAFALPHSEWIPLKFQLSPEDIPLGVLNGIFIAALILFCIGKSRHNSNENHIKSYTLFVLITLMCAIIGFMVGYEQLATAISIVKNQSLLLMLYFIPLTAISNKSEFKKVFYLFLFVHLIVAIEVMRSGVLAGSSFNDNKRGSGPFSLGLAGSDVAASYLAQVLMYFVAFFWVKEIKIREKVICILSSIIILFGIFATYSRGALFAVAFGVISMIFILGLKPKYLFILLLIGVFSLQFAPESIITRMDNTTTESGEFDESTQGRFVYWDAAFEIIKDNPLGAGTGQVRAAMQEKVGKHVDPHNGFLYTACEYGVIGLVVFCLFIYNLFKGARSVWLDANNHLIYRVYALGTGGMIGSFVVCNMFYANFYKDLVMGTIAIHFGLMAFIISNIKKDTEGSVI